MHDYDQQMLHDHITHLENRTRRLQNNTAPTVPVYDLSVSVGNVLSLDSIHNDAVIERNFTSIAEAYIEIDLAFGSGFLTNLVASKPDAVELIQFYASDFRSVTGTQIGTVNLFLDCDGSGTLGWQMELDGGFGSGLSRLSPPLQISILPLKWYHFAAHLKPGVSPVIWTGSIDGTNITGLDLSSTTMTDIQYLDLEEVSGVALVHEYVYMRNLKVGTILGGSDLVIDNFDTPPVNPTIWNSFISSDAAIVTNPGIT